MYGINEVLLHLEYSDVYNYYFDHCNWHYPVDVTEKLLEGRNDVPQKGLGKSDDTIVYVDVILYVLIFYVQIDQNNYFAIE